MKTQYLLNEQVDRVLAALTKENELVCRACLRTGLRVSDVLQLRPEQIVTRCWVTESKTGKAKQIGFDEALRAEILQHASAVWAFPGRDPSKHRTRQAVWRDIKRAARAFRLPQNAGTHSMRKVYAVQLMEKYGDIERVRKALNHDRYTTTMIYAMADKLMQEKPKRHPYRTR